MFEIKHPLTAPFDYVFPEDPAVNQSDSKYSPSSYEADWDPNHLPLRTGERATRFTCRRLSRVVMTRIARLVGPDATDNHAEAHQLAVAHGLRSIGDGPADLVLSFSRDGEALDPKTMDALYDKFGFGFFHRLGDVIVRRSSPSPF